MPLLAQNLNLKIEGKDNVETAIVDSIGYTNISSDYKSVEQEINKLSLKLQKAGYIENEVTYSKRVNDSTYLTKLSLNKKFYTIYIYYNKNEIPREVLEQFSNNVTSEYFITTIERSENILNQINSKIIEDGQPFASLKLTDLKKRDNNNIQANLSINIQTTRTIDKVIIKGYEKFPKSFCKHFLKIRTNDLLDLKVINDKTELLNALPFANQRKAPEILFTNDSSSLYIYLEKTKSNNFDGFLGFGTNEATNKIEFDGYLNLNLRNNLNYGESFNLIYKSDENEQKTFQVEMDLPYLFGSSIGSEMSLNIFKKDSSFTTVNQAASLYYQINSKSKIFAGISSTQSNRLLDNNQTNININDYDALFYNVRYQYVKRQTQSNLFTTNFLFDVKTSIGQRNFEGSSKKQSLLEFDISKIFNLNSKNSVFIGTKGVMQFSDVFLENELSRFGGINSIRGFEENSIPSSLYGLINVEYRFLLSNSIYIHSITDAAYFENNLINQTEKLYGFGFGFGFITQAGLLKINYANGKSENQNFQLSNSKIHISLNAIF